MSGRRLNPEWVTAVGQIGVCIILLVSLVLVIWQVTMDHDQRARQLALDVCKEWDRVVKEDNFRYVDFVFSLNSETINELCLGHPIAVDSQIVAEYLPECHSRPGAPLDTVPAEKVRKIRWTLVNELNSIESIALVYLYSAANRDILDDAFYNLLIDQCYLKKCEAFRKSFGDSAWVAILRLKEAMELRAGMPDSTTT